MCSKLYARVEDNDPAGAKGSESPVVTVKIISNEQMQQMLLAREGLETLLSKYAEAQRRLEAASDQIEKLLKELEKEDPNSEIAKETREELKKAADEMGKDAEKLAGLAAQDLPFDLDHALKKQLDTATQSLEKTADQLQKMARKPGLSAGPRDRCWPTPRRRSASNAKSSSRRPPIRWSIWRRFIR